MFKQNHSVKQETKEKQAAIDKIRQTVKKDPFEDKKVESKDPEVDKLF